MLIVGKVYWNTAFKTVFLKVIFFFFLTPLPFLSCVDGWYAYHCVNKYWNSMYCKYFWKIDTNFDSFLSVTCLWLYFISFLFVFSGNYSVYPVLPSARVSPHPSPLPHAVSPPLEHCRACFRLARRFRDLRCRRFPRSFCSKHSHSRRNVRLRRGLHFSHNSRLLHESDGASLWLCGSRLHSSIFWSFLLPPVCNELINGRPVV